MEEVSLVLSPMEAGNICYARQINNKRIRFYMVTPLMFAMGHFTGKTPENIIEEYLRKHEMVDSEIEFLDYRVGFFRRMYNRVKILVAILFGKTGPLDGGEFEAIVIPNLSCEDGRASMLASYEQARPVIARVAKRMRNDLNNWEKIESKTKTVYIAQYSNKGRHLAPGVDVDVTLRNKSTGQIERVDATFRKKHE